MQVTVALGPGHHGAQLVELLARRQAVGRVFEMWPALTITDHDPLTGLVTRRRRVPGYALLTRATWAAWQRLPIRKAHDHPRTPLYALYDRVVSLALGHPQIFLGWSQVSGRALRTARARGAIAVLEHPMMYIDHWQALMEEEYRRHAQGVSHYYSLFPPAIVEAMKREYADASRIVVASSAARDTFVRAGVPEDKLLTIAYGVDAELFRPPPRLSSGGRPFRVLYVGRLELLKGVHHLLEAWSTLRLPASELVLAGLALPEIQPVLARHAGPTVRVLGALPREELPAVYADADVVVLPSLGEGFGLTVLEAMACGVPVIATDQTGARDAVREGVEGFLVPIRDPKALGERLRWCHGHRAVLPELGRRGRERVMAHYTLDHYGQRLHDTFTHLLEHPPCAASSES